MDSSEVIRAAAGVGIVLANWFVYRGVALEESDDPWTKDTGKILLRRALLAETILALGLVFIDSWISIGQKAEIIRLTTPRNLTPAAVSNVEMKVCPFGPKQFDLVFVTLDEVLFHNELAKIWRDCKWQPASVIENQDAAIASVSDLAGIRLLYDEGHAAEFKEAAEAFAKALRDEKIDAVAGPIPASAQLSKNIIHIQLGRRP